jgi:hypothetical protein
MTREIALWLIGLVAFAGIAASVAFIQPKLSLRPRLKQVSFSLPTP